MRWARPVVFVPLSTSTTVSAGAVVDAATPVCGFAFGLAWWLELAGVALDADVVAALFVPQEPPRVFAVPPPATRISSPPRISATGRNGDRLRAARRGSTVPFLVRRAAPPA